MKKIFILTAAFFIYSNVFSLTKGDMLKIYAKEKHQQIEVSKKRIDIIDKMYRVKSLPVDIRVYLDELRSLDIDEKQQEIETVYSSMEASANKERKIGVKNKAEKNKKIGGLW